MLDHARVVVILPVIDLERAKRFYQDKLGLEPRDIEGAAQMGAVVKCGAGTEIILYASRSAGKADYALWQVEDIEAVVDMLCEKGVVFEQYDLPGLKTNARGIAEVGDGRSAWFRDTEGNLLSITEFR